MDIIPYLWDMFKQCSEWKYFTGVYSCRAIPKRVQIVCNKKTTATYNDL